MSEPVAEVHAMNNPSANKHRDSSSSSCVQQQRHMKSTSSSSTTTGDKRRSQTIEMRTIHRTDASDSSSQSSGGGGGYADLRQRASVEKPASSIAYALQAAANSALSAAGTSQPSIGVGTESSSTQRTLLTSNRDKPSERAAVQQQQQQPTSASSSSAGPIQASLELVKQVSHQMQQQQLWAQKASTSYHDDYEYSYGLVQPPMQLQPDDQTEMADSMELIPADGAPRTGKSATKGANSAQPAPQRTSRKGSKYRMVDESLVAASADFVGGHSKGPTNYENDELLYDDGDQGARNDTNDDRSDDRDDEDDFEHDGRLSLTRSSVSSSSTATSRAKRHSGSRPSSRAKPTNKSRGKQQALPNASSDAHRINSVALIAATLSAGGVIVESGSGSSAGDKQSTLLDSGAAGRH